MSISQNSLHRMAVWPSRSVNSSAGQTRTENMDTTVAQFQLASAAAGFTLGFGFLCIWNAIKQTRSIESPLRSGYICMVWGEIISNLAIAVIGWLFLNGTIKSGYVSARSEYIGMWFDHFPAFPSYSVFSSFGCSKLSFHYKSSSIGSTLFPITAGFYDKLK